VLQGDEISRLRQVGLSLAPHRRLWQKGTRSSATTLAVGTFLAYGSVFDAARASL
jgi:hypothetical protein